MHFAEALPVAARDYIQGIAASLASRLFRKGGFVATVLGHPVARDFNNANPSYHLDTALEANGFEMLWKTDRPIYWHCNHGYARLKKERVSEHIKL